MSPKEYLEIAEEYIETALNGQFDPAQTEAVRRIFIEFSVRCRPNRSDYRLAAERLFKFLSLIDEQMVHSRHPDRTWREIALAFGLPSTRYFRLTEAALGRQFGLTKMAISKSVTKLVRKAEKMNAK